MAFNTLEYLEKGNVDFVYNLTRYDRDNLIKFIRESENRVNIINGFLPKLKKKLPAFCFEIIYDIDEFKDDALELLNKHYLVKPNDKRKKYIVFSKELFKTFVTNSSLAFQYLESNFDEILSEYKDDLDFIFKLLFLNYDKSQEILKKLSIHPDLHIRYLFMKYLICNYYNLIGDFYDDIIKYLTSDTYEEFEQITFIKEYMQVSDICDLAFTVFDVRKDYELWLKFKKFILENYRYNELAYRLLECKKETIGDHSYKLVKNKNGIAEFNRDSNSLFRTALKGKLYILKNHITSISKEVLEEYKKSLVYFYQNGKLDCSFEHLERYGLDRMLNDFISKYLDISSDKSHEFLERGSTSSCYRIGDFVFKLVQFKWSYEQELCPNLYLILPNLEEKFIRSKEGYVLSGIEVQRYLKRSARDVPGYVFSKFQEELNRLGYFSTDTLIGGKCGDNCRLLDDYRDSDNPNPPDWFKEYPLVLVDRDRIYSSDNHFIKQLGSY